MPAIYLFQRRTLLGGDDIQPAAVLTIAGRFVQFALFCIPVLRHTLFDPDSCGLGQSSNDSGRRSSILDILHKAAWWMAGISESDDLHGTADRSFLVSESTLDSCQDGNWSVDAYCPLMNVWIASTVGFYCVMFSLLEWRIVHQSSQGTPTEIEPRSTNVARLLEFKLYPCSILLFIIFLTGATAIAMAPQFYGCQNYIPSDVTANEDATFISSVSTGTRRMSTTHNVSNSSNSYYDFTAHIWRSLSGQWWWLAVSALLLTQIIEVIVSWIFLWQLSRLPIDLSRSERRLTANGHEDAVEEDDLDGPLHLTQYNHELVEEMWAEQCAASCQCFSSLSCYMFGGRNLASSGPSAFVDVARALADFMESRGVLDVVPSDIVTGLVILQRLQRQRVYTARQKFLKQISTTTVLGNGSDLIEEGDQQVDVILAPDHLNRSGGTIRKRISNKNLADPTSGMSSEGLDVLPSRSEDFLLPHTAAHSPVFESHRDLYMISDNGSYRLEERAVLNRSNHNEMFLLHEVARYAKYALAIYSWVLYLYVHPLSGPIRLISQNGGACFCNQSRRVGGSHQPISSSSTAPHSNCVNEKGCIEGDNFCQTHKRSILLTAGLHDADLVYVQLKSSFEDIPYCILLDHGWKSVVVSIRGTFSLEDCVTDVLISPESLEQLGREFGFNASGQYCHGGVMTCARHVYADLQRHGLLDELLLGDNARFPGYSLRLVGHSLGAATCTLVSYMLRQKYPNVRCVNYSPPGCTFTWDMAVQCSSWCTSCVLDTDLVPRLKLESMERLRNEILELVGRIKVPKIEVAQRFVQTSILWGCRLCYEQGLDAKESLMESINDVLHETDSIPDSEYQQQLSRFKRIQDDRRQQRGTARLIELYPPGRILHLAKTGDKRTCSAGVSKLATCCMTNAGALYVPIWVNNDDLNEIVVSPTMGTDHFPNRIRDVLEDVAKEFGLS